MKKLSLAISLVAMGALLAGCGASNLSADGTKSKLEGSGFTVKILSNEEYKATFGSLLEPTEGFQSYLVGNKHENLALKGYISAWFFDSIDHADAFSNKYIATLASVLDIEEIELKVGSHNNVVYAASENAISAAGLKPLLQ